MTVTETCKAVSEQFFYLLRRLSKTELPSDEVMGNTLAEFSEAIQIPRLEIQLRMNTLL